jgi:hypothetical protein
MPIGSEMLAVEETFLFLPRTCEGTHAIRVNGGTSVEEFPGLQPKMLSYP